ncbi:MAG: NAD(P)/FAD-dependent oxidoreductase, partial [Oceanobacter sp.]
MSKIAIIGAGIAGLSALQRLAASGHEVWVFDKSRGSGGRIASKRVGDASWDMGAQFLVAHGTEFANQLADWERAGWIAEWPVVPWVIKSGLQEPSPDDQKRYVAMPRMTSLSRCLLKPAQEFITSTRITSLKREGQHWNLESESGQRWENFDKVVLAIPPEQASALLADAPELLPLCDQIMLPCWTLLLSYSRRLEAPFEAAFVKDHAISWIARNNSKPMRDDRETWVIQANHQWSREHCDAPRAEVQQKLLSEF